MNRVLFAFFSAFFALIAVINPRPATAGEYYDDDYYRPQRPYYRDDERSYYRRSYYERPYYRDYERPHYRRSYYERPYYRDSYYDRPRYRPSYRSTYYESSYRYYDPPRRTYSSSYYSYPTRRYSGNDYSYSSRDAGNGDDQPRRLYAEGCSPRKYKINDDQGGWVWGTRTVCD